MYILIILCYFHFFLWIILKNKNINMKNDSK